MTMLPHGFPKLELPHWLKHELAAGGHDIHQATNASMAYLLRNLKSNITHESAKN